MPSDGGVSVVWSGTMFSPVGNAIGVALPPLVVDIDDRGHVTGMPAFMAAQAVACGLSFLWALGCLRSYPPLPPSESTRQRQALHLAARTEGSWTASLHEVGQSVVALTTGQGSRLLVQEGLTNHHWMCLAASFLLRHSGVARTVQAAAGPALPGDPVVVLGRPGLLQRAADAAEPARAAVQVHRGGRRHARRHLPGGRWVGA